MIYAIEAIDAAGKATQARHLADRLGCQVLSFPDYASPTLGGVRTSPYRASEACR